MIPDSIKQNKSLIDEIAHLEAEIAAHKEFVAFMKSEWERTHVEGERGTSWN